LLDSDLRAEAERQFSICNACRYCEGLCSVFPAMELRTAFSDGDVGYLANLCHDCRACIHACPFSPPHQLAVDIPALLSTIRVESFVQHARPRFMWAVLNRPKALLLLVVSAMAVVGLLAVLFDDPSRLVHTTRGKGAFYEIVAYIWLVVPATTAGLLSLAAIVAGVIAALREDGKRALRLLNARAAWRALIDVLGLANLRGGGSGCHVDDDQPTSVRRRLHFLVFYGFGLMFAATVSAAIEQDIFGVQPPYPVISVPVLLGTIGGFATIAGCIGFLSLALSSKSTAITSESRRIGRVFNSILVATTASGLLVLLLRSTAAMPLLLLFHLALVGAFFLALPYGKFVHSAYRYAALVRYHVERRNPELATDGVMYPASPVIVRDQADRQPVTVED
jgi:citrate/tricarballylate utilization protein